MIGGSHLCNFVILSKRRKRGSYSSRGRIICTRSTKPCKESWGHMRRELDEALIAETVKAELRARIEATQKKGMEAKEAALAGRVIAVSTSEGST